MEKIITLTIMIVLSMSMTLAYYPGETIVLVNDMGTDDLVYTISGNSTAIGDLDITINDTNITVTFPQDMSPDIFDIIFFRPIEVEVEKRVEVEVEVEVEGDIEYEYLTKWRDRNVTEIEYLTEFIEVETIVNQTIESEPIIINNGIFEIWHMIISIIGTVIIMVIIFMVITKIGKKGKNGKKDEKEKYNDDETVADPFKGVKGYNPYAPK